MDDMMPLKSKVKLNCMDKYEDFTISTKFP